MDNPIPPEEDVRNLSVENLRQLDTPAEERFDRLTRLAKRAFNAPFCMMTLIHQDRQWFKSTQGHSIPETPRVESFCKHAIMSDETLVVEDASADPRFFDLPVVFDMGIRFYAGVPIHSPDRQRVGTLCILDTEKKSFQTDDQALLEDLALCIESELQREHWSRAEKELVRKLEELKKRAALDDVTRCWNESAIRSILARSLDQRNVSLALVPACLMIHVNSVDELNKEYGVETGDQLLRAVANRLRRFHTFHEKPVAIGRMLGPQFLLVFDELDVQESKTFCFEILSTVSEEALRHPRGSTPIELHAGMALGSSLDKDAESLLQSAASALKRALQHKAPMLECSQ